MSPPMLILADGQSLMPAAIGAASALTVAVVAAWLGYQRYLRERVHEQETRLNALFGELANLFEHYSCAAYELPTTNSDERELRLRLQWASYGDLQSAHEIGRYGFLSAGDIRLLLQLGLRIRNTDRLLDVFLHDLSSVTSDDLVSAKRRMIYARGTANELLNRLALARPRLESILVALKKELPAIGEVA